jgi:hypothetical protein
MGDTRVLQPNQCSLKIPLGVFKGQEQRRIAIFVATLRDAELIAAG